MRLRVLRVWILILTVFVLAQLGCIITGDNFTVIVFTSNRTGSFEIYTSTINGSSLTRLTFNSVDDYDPSFNLQGTRIAFIRHVGPGNASELRTMNADGGGEIPLVSSSEFMYSPKFSPNGQVIVFSARVGGSDLEICRINTDGTGFVVLTNNSVNDDYPCFSADGSRIVFARDTGGARQLVVMNANGTNQVPLTGGNDDFSPYWSPVVDRIIFSRQTTVSSYNLFSINPDGSGLAQLTFFNAISWGPVITPGGTKAVFTSDQTGNPEVFSMDVNGSNVQNITNHPSDDYTIF